MYKDAECYVFDEAFSSLDIDVRASIFNSILEDKKNSLLIFVTDRLSELKKMDNIYVLDNGKIVQSGSHKELMKDIKRIYFSLYKEL